MHKCTKSKHSRFRRHLVFEFGSGGAIAHPHSVKSGERAWGRKLCPTYWIQLVSTLVISTHPHGGKNKYYPFREEGRSDM